MTSTTYTFHDASFSTIQRGLTLAAAGRARLDDADGHWTISMEIERDDWTDRRHKYEYDSERDGEGYYVLVHELHGRHEPTVVSAAADTRAEAERAIYEEVAFVEWPRTLRGEVVADEEFDRWIAEARETRDANQLRCYGFASEAEAIEEDEQ